MGDNIDKISSASDLYKRVLPAIETKISELKRENIKFVDHLDIWNYCVENFWKNKSDLRIYEIVDDILNVDGLKVEIFIRNNLANYRKIIDKDEIK